MPPFSLKRFHLISRDRNAVYVVDVERRKNGHKFEEQNWRGEEGRRNFLGHILAHRLSERDSLVTCRSVAILFDTCLPTLELPEWSDIFDNTDQQDEFGCH